MTILCENGLVKTQCYMKVALQYIEMILLYTQLYTSIHHYRNENINTHTKNRLLSRYVTANIFTFFQFKNYINITKC